MKPSTVTIVVLLAAALGARAPASAGQAGACQLEFHIGFDAAGRIVQAGAGAAVCAGYVGSTTVDSLTPAAADLSGSSRRGVVGCLPVLTEGRLSISLRPMVSFDPDPTFSFNATWSAGGLAPATTLSGSGTARGHVAQFLGDLRFIPQAAGCSRGGRLAPGTVHMDLVLGEGRQPLERAGFIPVLRR